MRVGRAVHSRRRSKRPAMRVGERHDGVEVALDPAPQAPVEDRAQAEVKLAQEAQAVVRRGDQIGRAACRERVCQYGAIPVVAVSLQYKHTQPQTIPKTTETK